jgi:polysaccharide pyruvyl transferase WcaK-like protein
MGAVAFGLREPASLDLMHAMGLTDAGAVEVVGDDALGLERPSELSVDAALLSAGLPEGTNYLVAHAREADYVGVGRVALQSWADAVDTVAARRGLAVLGVSLNHQQPHPEADTLAWLATASSRRARWHILDCDSSPGLAAAVVGRAQGAIVHSYHEAMFALEAGVPAVLTAATPYYELKATGLARYASVPVEAFVLRPTDGLGELDARLDAVRAALQRGGGLRGACERVDAWLDRALTTAVVGRSDRPNSTR